MGLQIRNFFSSKETLRRIDDGGYLLGDNLGRVGVLAVAMLASLGELPGMILALVLYSNYGASGMITLCTALPVMAIGFYAAWRYMTHMRVLPTCASKPRNSA